MSDHVFRAPAHVPISCAICGQEQRFHHDDLLATVNKLNSVDTLSLMSAGEVRTLFRALVARVEQAEAENAALRERPSNTEKVLKSSKAEHHRVTTAWMEERKELIALRQRHAEELADEQRKVRIALLMVKKSEAELAEIKGQTCATCRHSYTPLSVMLACCLTKDDAGDGLSCETFGHRCGAWARREP